MDYFIMKTDRRLRLLPQIQFSKEGIGTNVMKQSIAYVKEYTGRCIDYPDYLEKPYPLIADKYRKILQKYQQDMDLQRVMLIEKESGKQTPYCLICPAEIVCAMEFGSSQ